MEYSIAEKIAYVEEYRESGLSQSQFAKTKGIAPTTFSGWLRLERALAFGEIDLNKSNITHVETTTNTKVINIKKSTIFVKDDIRIELKEGYDKELLKKIVEVLVGC